MINTLKTLCALSGVSSFEDEVRDYIRQRVTPYATDLRVDAMGNLIVLKKGARATGNKLMLCAHMDEVGLIIKSITEDGYLKFGCVGGIDRRVLLGKQVALGEQKVTGVIGLKAIHMTTAEERKKVPKLEEYYIDIGVKSREEAEKLVGIGDCGVFVSDVVEFGDGMLKAKAICAASGLPAIADDSGLCVDALNGGPGVYSARYGGEELDDRGRYTLLLQNMRGQTTRAAHFACAIACAFPGGDELTAEGRCDGAIAFAPMGTAGFGYDPVFLVPEKGRTFGQLTAEEKGAISHRGKALRAFSEKLATYLKK